MQDGPRWKRLLTPAGIPTWIVGIVLVANQAFERWDWAEQVAEKIRKLVPVIGPFLAAVYEELLTGRGQLLLIGLGLFLMAFALWREPNWIAKELSVLFRKDIQPTVAEALMTLEHIGRDLGQRGGTPAQYALMQLVQECIGQRVDQATNGLRQLATGKKRGDFEDAFVAFYESYQRLIYWLRDSAAGVGYALDKDGNFQVWKQCDRKFRVAFRELVARANSPKLNEASRHMWPIDRDLDYDGFFGAVASSDSASGAQASPGASSSPAAGAPEPGQPTHPRTLADGEKPA